MPTRGAGVGPTCRLVRGPRVGKLKAQISSNQRSAPLGGSAISKKENFNQFHFVYTHAGYARPRARTVQFRTVQFSRGRGGGSGGCANPPGGALTRYSLLVRRGDVRPIVVAAGRFDITYRLLPERLPPCSSPHAISERVSVDALRRRVSFAVLPARCSSSRSASSCAVSSTGSVFDDEVLRPAASLSGGRPTLR